MPKTVDIPTATAIRATDNELVIALSDREVTVRWENCSPRLARATAEQRRAAEMSPGGYGIHWPLVDEDLSIAGLLQVK